MVYGIWYVVGVPVAVLVRVEALGAHRVQLVDKDDRAAVARSVSQSVGQSISQSVSQSVSRSVSQSVGQSISQVSQSMKMIAPLHHIPALVDCSGRGNMY